MREKRDEIIILRTTKAEKNRIYEKMLSMGIVFAVLRDQKPFELKTPEQHAVEQGFVKAA